MDSCVYNDNEVVADESRGGLNGIDGVPDAYRVVCPKRGREDRVVEEARSKRPPEPCGGRKQNRCLAAQGIWFGYRGSVCGVVGPPEG